MILNNAALPRRLRKRSGGVALTIAIAIPFDSGVLLCADTSRIPSAQIRLGSTRIFQKRYDSKPSYARSIFVISDPVNSGIVVVQQCERALDLLHPAEYTIDGMRATIENSLLETYQEQLDSEFESNPTASLLIALYSSADQRYSLFRTNGIALMEHVGYDCQGSAAYVGHFLLRDRYEAAESMGALDLTTVFSIATETLESVREYSRDSNDTVEIIIMFANGRASEVRHIHQGACRREKLALLADLSVA
jgi:hypothetical protein